MNIRIRACIITCTGRLRESSRTVMFFVKIVLFIGEGVEPPKSQIETRARLPPGRPGMILSVGSRRGSSGQRSGVDEIHRPGRSTARLLQTAVSDVWRTRDLLQVSVQDRR